MKRYQVARPTGGDDYKGYGEHDKLADAVIELNHRRRQRSHVSFYIYDYLLDREVTEDEIAREMRAP